MSLAVVLAPSGVRLTLRFLQARLQISELTERINDRLRRQMEPPLLLLDKRGHLYFDQSEIDINATGVSLAPDSPQGEVVVFTQQAWQRARQPHSPEEAHFWQLCGDITIYGEILSKPFDFSKIPGPRLSSEKRAALQKYEKQLMTGFFNLAGHLADAKFSHRERAELQQRRKQAQTGLILAVEKKLGAYRSETAELDQRVKEQEACFMKTVQDFERSLQEMERTELREEVRAVMQGKRRLIDIYFDKNQMIQWRHNCGDLKKKLMSALAEYHAAVGRLTLPRADPDLSPPEQDLDRLRSIVYQVHQKVQELHSGLQTLAITDSEPPLPTTPNDLAKLKAELMAAEQKMQPEEVKGAGCEMAQMLKTVKEKRDALHEFLEKIEKNASYLRKPRRFIELFEAAVEECSRRRQFDRQLGDLVERLQTAISQEQHVRSEFKNAISQVFPKNCLLALTSTAVGTLTLKLESAEGLPTIDLEKHREDGAGDKKMLPLKMLGELGGIRPDMTVQAAGSALRGASAEELARRLKEQSDYVNAQRVKLLQCEKTLQIRENELGELQRKSEKQEEQIRKVSRKMEEAIKTLRDAEESCAAVGANQEKIEKWRREQEGNSAEMRKQKDKLWAEEVQESLKAAHRIIHQVCSKSLDLLALRVGQKEEELSALRLQLVRVKRDSQDALDEMRRKLRAAEHERAKASSEDEKRAEQVKKLEREAGALQREVDKERKKAESERKRLKIVEDQLHVASEKQKEAEQALKEARAGASTKIGQLSQQLEAANQKLKKARTDVSSRATAFENKKLELENAQKQLKALEKELQSERRKVAETEGAQGRVLSEAQKKMQKDHKDMLTKLHQKHSVEVQEWRDRQREAGAQLEEVAAQLKEAEGKLAKLEEDNRSKSLSLLELNQQLEGMCVNQSSEQAQLQAELAHRAEQVDEWKRRAQEEAQKVEILEDQIARQENSPVKDPELERLRGQLADQKERAAALEQERDAGLILGSEKQSQLETQLRGQEEVIQQLREALEERAGEVAAKSARVEELEGLAAEFEASLKRKTTETRELKDKTALLQQRLQEVKEDDKENDNKENKNAGNGVVDLLGAETGKRMLFLPRALFEQLQKVEASETSPSYVGLTLSESGRSGQKVERHRCGVTELDVKSLEENQRLVLRAHRMLVVGRVREVRESGGARLVGVGIEHLVGNDRGGWNQYSYLSQMK